MVIFISGCSFLDVYIHFKWKDYWKFWKIVMIKAAKVMGSLGSINWSMQAGQWYCGGISSWTLSWWGHCGCNYHWNRYKCLLCGAHRCNYQVSRPSNKFWRHGISLSLSLIQLLYLLSFDARQNIKSVFVHTSTTILIHCLGCQHGMGKFLVISSPQNSLRCWSRCW